MMTIEDIERLQATDTVKNAKFVSFSSSEENKFMDDWKAEYNKMSQECCDMLSD